jgi:hypothetical protein
LIIVPAIRITPLVPTLVQTLKPISKWDDIFEFESRFPSELEGLLSQSLSERKLVQPPGNKQTNPLNLSLRIPQYFY